MKKHLDVELFANAFFHIVVNLTSEKSGPSWTFFLYPIRLCISGIDTLGS